MARTTPKNRDSDLGARPLAAPRRWYDRALAAGTLLLFLASVAVLTQGIIAPEPMRLLLPLRPLLEEGPIALGWMLAALGWGWGLRRFLEPRGGVMGLTVQMALGVAALMLLDGALGTLGLLNVYGAWALSVAGWVLLGEQVRDSRDELDRSESWPKLPWPVVAAVPAIAALIVAACVAPGLLWQQPGENMGYDVLEYHLQMPKEWIAAGRIGPLEHNVYSYMPNLFEAAFMHLGVWRDSLRRALPFSSGAGPAAMVGAGISVQLLHAALTLLAAVGVARIVTHVSDRRAGAAAAAVYLAVPWTTLTGALAYNEQAMMALGVAAVLAVVRGGAGAAAPGAPMTGLRAGFVIGLLCGAATLTKLTAAGLIALPVAILLLLQHGRAGRRATLRRLAGFLAAFALIVSLWLVRNFAWCGHPVFPLLTHVLGHAPHWTAEQAARWTAATRPNDPPGESLRLLLASSRGLWSENFGYALWPAAALGAILGLRRPALRKLTLAMILMAAVTILFWLFFTHHQSRFLIPLLLPACVLVGLGVAAAPPIAGSRVQPAFSLAACLVLLCTGLTYRTYLVQYEGHAPMLIDGTVFMLRTLPPHNTLNALPPSRRIYAEGYATPFYIQTPLTYHTCWDASPLGEAMRRGGAAEALRWLKAEHYTHLLVDDNMLRLWTSPGNYGYDPSITLDSLKAVAQQLKPPIDMGGVVLFTIPEEPTTHP